MRYAGIKMQIELAIGDKLAEVEISILGSCRPAAEWPLHRHRNTSLGSLVGAGILATRQGNCYGQTLVNLRHSRQVCGDEACGFIAFRILPPLLARDHSNRYVGTTSIGLSITRVTNAASGHIGAVRRPHVRSTRSAPCLLLEAA